jgi:hypothetical protein
MRNVKLAGILVITLSFILLAAGCEKKASSEDAAALRIADREAIVTVPSSRFQVKK